MAVGGVIGAGGAPGGRIGPGGGAGAGAGAVVGAVSFVQATYIDSKNSINIPIISLIIISITSSTIPTVS